MELQLILSHYLISIKMLKHSLLKVASQIVKYKINRWASRPIITQKRQLSTLLKKGSKTIFGKDHNFKSISSYKDFKSKIPVRDYEELKEYFERTKKGEKDILWPGKPIYFAITSGTTSGAKHIPITKDSLPNHLNGAKNALLMYVANTGNTKFIDGRFIFVQGSPLLKKTAGILTGRLSGISAHHVPFYMKNFMLPSWNTNIIEDWEKKVEKIIDETINENMTIISGIPSWLQMYFEKISNITGKSISSVFPNFNLLIHGGVNFKPYKEKFNSLIGKKVDTIELFPASEGFYAFQDSQNKEELLLILNAGIFYEFIKDKDFIENKKERISIENVKLNTNYLLIISSSAGLWGYNTGDTIQFTSLKPYKIIVTGRIKQYLSAFGEHVIVKEIEQAIQKAIKETGLLVNEFTVAPRFKSNQESACHEWFVEFETKTNSTKNFVQVINQELMSQNKYYKDLIEGNIISNPVVTCILKGGFKRYMQHIGKLGGQNKIPKIANDRKIANALKKLKLIKPS